MFFSHDIFRREEHGRLGVGRLLDSAASHATQEKKKEICVVGNNGDVVSVSVVVEEKLLA